MRNKTALSLIRFILTALSGPSLIIVLILLSLCRTVEASEVRILLVGDTSFGENYLEAYGPKDLLKTKGYEYSIMNFIPILRGSDTVIANLETPLTDNLMSPLPGKKYLHWSSPENAPAYLKKFNISAVSLANNHIMDYGINGLKDTINALGKSGIEWFGAGSGVSDAEKPLIKEFSIGTSTFRIAVIGAFEYRKHYHEKFRVYAEDKNGGTNMLAVERISRQIRNLKKETPDIFIIVFPHWGRNYRWKIPYQSDIAHRLIDAGADLVAGHGSHSMQELEKYNGRWIIHSLGNFVFNSPGRYQKVGTLPYSLIAQLVINNNKGKLSRSLKLYPIMTDNLRNGYQGRFLTGEEFKEAYTILKEKSSLSILKKGKDIIGMHIEITLD